MQREIMTSIPFLSQPSAAAENTEEDLAVAQDLKDTLDRIAMVAWAWRPI